MKYQNHSNNGIIDFIFKRFHNMIIIMSHIQRVKYQNRIELTQEQLFIPAKIYRSRIKRKAVSQRKLLKDKQAQFPSVEKLFNKQIQTNKNSISQDQIKKRMDELIILWENNDIPEKHMKAFRSIIQQQQSLKQRNQLINNQFNEITNQNSLIQKAMLSIEIRENCIYKIKQSILNIDSISSFQLIRTDFQQKINHLRLLTIYCIECLNQWKQSINSMIKQPITMDLLIYGSQSFIQKISEDIQDLKSLKAAIIYNFSQDQDPFLLNIFDQNERIVNISNSLRKRIKKCEELIMQCKNVINEFQQTQQKYQKQYQQWNQKSNFQTDL